MPKVLKTLVAGAILFAALGCGGAGSGVIAALLKPLVLSLIGEQSFLGLYDSKTRKVVQIASFAGVVVDVVERKGSFYVMISRGTENELYRVPSIGEDPALLATLPATTGKIAVSPAQDSFAIAELDGDSYALSLFVEGDIVRLAEAGSISPTALQWTETRGILFVGVEDSQGVALRTLDPSTSQVQTILEAVRIVDFDYDDATGTAAVHVITTGENPRSVFIVVNAHTGQTVASVEMEPLSTWRGMAFDGTRQVVYFERDESLMMLDMATGDVAPAPGEMQGELLYVARTDR